MFSSGRYTDFSAGVGVELARQQMQSLKVGDKSSSTAGSAELKPELKTLYQRQKARMDDAKVKPGSWSAMRSTKLTGKDALNSLQDVIGTAAASALIGYASASFSAKEGESANSHIAQAATASLTGSATTLVKNIANNFLNKGTITEVEAEIATFATLKKNTTPEMLKRLPADVQTEIKQLDFELEDAIRDIANGESGPSAVWFQQRLRHRELVLMAVPTEAKVYGNFKGNPQGLKAFHQKIDKIIADYPAENTHTLENIVQRIMTNSTSKDPERVQVYMFGPGGVGKTRLVRKLAEAFEAPLIEIKVPEKELGDILGEQRLPRRFMGETDADDKLIGELQTKIIESGHTNPFIFIDEMKLTGWNLNDLKMLLDPSKDKLKTGIYNANIDWKNPIIFIGSNDKLTDAPLLSRLTPLPIERNTDAARYAVAEARTQQTLEMYKERVSEGQFKKLTQKSKEVRDKLVETDKASFPGVRVLESVAADVVHFIAAGAERGKGRSAEQINSFIDSRYEQAINALGEKKKKDNDDESVVIDFQEG